MPGDACLSISRSRIRTAAQSYRADRTARCRRHVHAGGTGVVKGIRPRGQDAGAEIIPGNTYHLRGRAMS